MSEFFSALADYGFLRYALFAGLLASLSCGVVGTYVVVRRISVVAGALAHCVLGGMGASYYLRAAAGLDWLHPLHGAVGAALLAALILGAARARGHEREDTLIAALWAIGMALGVLFLFKSPGYKADLTTYLFGNIVLVDGAGLQLLIALDVLVLGVSVAFFNQLQAVCFDEEFARLRGVSVGFYYTLLLVLVALAIVTLVYVVGIVLVIALLTLPVSIAGRFTRRLGSTMALAALLSALFTSAGLALSYGPDLPVGATTILLAGAVYVLTMVFGRKTRRA